jgi:hypothetical protein
VRLIAARTPIVAAVQGAAVGGGLGLALAADFRIATPSTRFIANFSRLGLHHGFGNTVTLPAVVGQQHALDMLYTGRAVAGDERRASVCAIGWPPTRRCAQPRTSSPPRSPQARRSRSSRYVRPFTAIWPTACAPRPRKSNPSKPGSPGRPISPKASQLLASDGNPGSPGREA